MNNRRIESLEFDFFTNFIKKYWLLIFVCVIISLSCTYVINKYSARMYTVSTSVVINEESGGLADASAQILNEFGFISNNKSFANELQVLNSTPLINRAVEKLDFQISYYEYEVISERSLYKSSPFIVILDKNYPQPIRTKFVIEFIDKTTCKIAVNDEKVDVYSFVSGNVIQQIPKFEFEQIVKLDSYLYTDHMKIKILLNSSVDIEELQDKKYSFYINTQSSLVASYKARLDVLPADLESSVAQIMLDTENPEKGIDFLNKLTESYIIDELDKKRHSSIRTIEYINNQLNIVGDSLRRAEQDLQSFRTQNEVTDLSIQSGRFFEEMRELENQKAILNVNSKYYQYVKNFFVQNDKYDDLIAPSAMGINDPMLNNLIDELIRLNAERASFIENKQSKSPYLKKINIRIENLRKMVSENITYYEETNIIKQEDINSRIYKLNSEIRKLPATQRALVGIEREFNINDAIYTYLLEKRAEAEIAKASYQADTEIIEPAAMVGTGPITPKKTLNYIIGFLLGILVPVGIIRLLELTRTSFANLEEAEESVLLPILGKIYHNDKKCENIVESYPHAQVSENFRHLNIGLKYFFKDEKCKTIVITSAVGSEGKSFVALNSATSIANSGYKTVLLAFDLRKHKLSDFLSEQIGPNNNKGLTECISGQVEVDKVIRKTKNKNLDYMLSGIQAPNPGELISSDQTNLLFEKLKSTYDYIIVDTSPIGLVSDAYHLIDHCDLNVVILRLKNTPKSEFKALQQDLINKEINSCVLINDVSKGNKNGYGYYKED